jgi:hypothetical protein
VRIVISNHDARFGLHENAETGGTYLFLCRGEEGKKLLEIWSRVYIIIDNYAFSPYNLVTAFIVPLTLILYTLIMEAIVPPKRRLLTRATRRYISVGGILRNYRRENIKSCILQVNLRCEVFMAVKNAVIRDVTPCGSRKNRHFEGKQRTSPTCYC